MLVNAAPHVGKGPAAPNVHKVSGKVGTPDRGVTNTKVSRFQVAGGAVWPPLAPGQPASASR